MTKILISPNLRKRGIAEAVRQTYAALTANGATVLMARESAVLGEELVGIQYLELEQGVKSADAMVVLGGDGLFCALQI